MSHSSENFDPPADEELICSICHRVFNDPVECPCGHVFCRSCITRWLSDQKSCPACRRNVDHYSLQEVVPLIKNMIMKLTLRCPNSLSGCTVKPTYELYKSHIKNCHFKVVECSNDGCSTQILQKDLKIHQLEECAFRRITCISCELSVLRSDAKQHNCVSELRKLLKEKEELERKNEKKTSSP